MEIVLHRNDQPNTLGRHYTTAFQNARELYLVSAYLTNWEAGFKLTPSCKHFRFIVGKDFGITRKQACQDVLTWLPGARKADFLVADQIEGFHPKAAFWRSLDGGTYMLIGSSNLSKAAFDRNVEANLVCKISEEDFHAAKEWIEWISTLSVPVSQDWLDQYVEAKRPGRGSQPRKADEPVVSFKLPKPRSVQQLLRHRRSQLAAYGKHRAGLERQFLAVANGSISSSEFYRDLPEHWGLQIGNRLQRMGWERMGAGADFQDLAQSYLAIRDVPKAERDDVVRFEMDRLHETRNPARKAFLSEMLCLRFPDAYPVLNDPVHRFIAANRIKPQRGSSEGAKYIDLAKKLRVALKANPDYPARNLAELDLLIRAEYGD
jgi:hypothetical protein